MAFETKINLQDSKYVYALNPSVKKFQLKDNGFVETMAGNYQLLRPIEATPQSKEGFQLKITVNRDLKTFKMSITAADGLRSINLFKGEAHEVNRDKFYFLMDGMIERGVFEKEEV